ICTAQALLAKMATAYAIWHGPAGLQAIAERIHGLAGRLAAGLTASGVAVLGASRFDTVMVEVRGKAKAIAAAAEKTGRLVRVIDADHIGVAFDETSTESDLEAIAGLFSAKAPAAADRTVPGKPRGKE
ncbi:glycine dehydrogenase (aminomethyl-transferring), partial [Mesorhizobium sp. M4A.F.Ca.ET.020.02.1.1]